MDEFNCEGLIGAAIGASIAVALEGVAADLEVLAAQADIANILEDGKIDDDEVDRFLDDMSKLLVGAILTGITSRGVILSEVLGLSGTESDDEEESEDTSSENIEDLPEYIPGPYGSDGNYNTMVNKFNDGDRVKVKAGNGEYFAATIKTTSYGGVMLVYDDLDGLKDECGLGQVSNTTSDSDDGVLNIPPKQATDGAAVTFDKDGNPSETKSVWDCCLGVKDYIGNKASDIKDDLSQGISNIKESYEEAGKAQEESNRNEYNKLVADEEDFENLQKQSNEWMNQGNDQLIDDAKDEFNNIIGNKHIIVGAGGSTSATCGEKEAATTSSQLDIMNGDTDILVTGDVGAGTGFSVDPISGSLQLTIADNGIPDMYGKSDSGGVTIGPFSADVSTSEHATTYSFNLGGEGVEAHATKSYTISKKDTEKQLNDFGDGYMQYLQDQITDKSEQDTDQMSEEDKKKKELRDSYYSEIERPFKGGDN